MIGWQNLAGMNVLREDHIPFKPARHCYIHALLASCRSDKREEK